VIPISKLRIEDYTGSLLATYNPLYNDVTIRLPSDGLVRADSADTDPKTLIDKLEVVDNVRDPENPQDIPLLSLETTVDGQGNRKVGINEDNLRQGLIDIVDVVSSVIDTLDSMDFDEVPHGSFGSSLNQSPGDGTSTSIQVSIFRPLEATVGDAISWTKTTEIGGEDFGMVTLEPGTYIICSDITCQWVGVPAGTYLPQVGNVLGEPFDFSQQQELHRRMTNVVTVSTTTQFKMRISFDAATPVMGFWINSAQIVKVAGGMSQTTVNHDSALTGQGSVAEPLGVNVPNVSQSVLADNVAPAFVPNTTNAVAGKPYVYGGKLYVANENYIGNWDASKFSEISLSDYGKRNSGFEEIWFTRGMYSNGDTVDIPISQVVGNKYKFSVDTTATLFSLYVYKSNTPGSGRSISNNTIFEYTDSDLSVGRDTLRIYFNNASNDYATIKIFAASKFTLDECLANVSNFGFGKESECDGCFVKSGTYSSGAKVDIPISQVVGNKYKFSVDTTAALFTLYVYKSNTPGSGRLVSNNTIFEYNDNDLSVGRDCVRVSFDIASSDSATIKLFKINKLMEDFVEPKFNEVTNLIGTPVRYPSVLSAYLNADGTTTSSGSRGVTDYIDVGNLESIVVSKAGAIELASKTWLCWYDSDKNFLSNERYNTSSVPSEQVNDVKVIVPSGAVYFRITLWSNSTPVEVTDGASIKYQIVDIKNPFNKAHRLAILGASYCTYSGWIPSEQLSWYPTVGDPSVNDVSVCWWYKLVQAMGWTLHYNDAWSGSTLCNNTREGMPAETTSMVNRAEISYGSVKTLAPKPSVILLCGGINDTSIGTDVGSVKYSDWTEDDLKKVAPAICKIFDTLTKYNPGALIINVSCNVSPAINSAMVTACEHYGVKHIKVTGISGDNVVDGHPNSAGHQSMFEQIYKALQGLA